MRSKIITSSIVLAVLAIPAMGLLKGNNSGLQPGETVVPFHPEHISGPLAGTKNCFPCTYGNLPAVQAWVHNEDSKVVAKLLHELQENIDSHKDKDFKAMLVLVVDNDKAKEASKVEVMKLIKDSKAKDVAVAYLNKDDSAVKDYKISLDSNVKNTVFFYKNRKIANTIVNMKLNTEGCSGMCEKVSDLMK